MEPTTANSSKHLYSEGEINIQNIINGLLFIYFFSRMWIFKQQKWLKCLSLDETVIQAA